MKNKNNTNEPVLTITKKFFAETLLVIKKQMEYDSSITDKLSEIYGGYIEPYNNYLMLEHLVNILIKSMEPYLKDEDESMINYFIYEINFGENYTDGCYTVNDENIDISTSKKLYDHLINEIERLNKAK